MAIDAADRRSGRDLHGVVADLLRRQHLADAVGRHDVVEVAHDLVGLHGTEAAGPYLQLLARMPGFARHDLDP